jgi:hypothetical protein
MRALHVAVPIALALALGGCASSQPSVMPDVVGKALDAALSDIKHAGVKDDVKITGGGVFGIVDKSNWQVCEQSPGVGSTVTDAPSLTVDRACGDQTPAPTESATEAAGVPSAQPSEATKTTPATADPAAAAAADEPLTAETNEDLAALLKITDTCSPEITDFADRYNGKAIAFDGNIGAMNHHGNTDTRYDMLIGIGDYSKDSAPGPSFQFRDVNATYDLHLTGTNIPDTIGVGNNLRIIAQIGAFESNSCLFLLEPISTEFR